MLDTHKQCAYIIIYHQPITVAPKKPTFHSTATRSSRSSLGLNCTFTSPSTPPSSWPREILGTSTPEFLPDSWLSHGAQEPELTFLFLYRFNQHVLVDTTPMPDHIPKVEEIGATSAPLMSAAYFIGDRCKAFNDDFMKCKAEANGRGEIECLKEGRKVTRCAASVYVSSHGIA